MNKSDIVFSTEFGKMCPQCEKPIEQCICNKKEKQSKKGSGRVRVQRETKGRKGKGVTVITGLPLTMDELKALTKSLKQKGGVGGTVKDGVIEIQGDQRDWIVEELKIRGYDAKRSGG